MNIKHFQVPAKQVFMDEGEIKAALLMMEQDVSLNTPGEEGLTFRQKHTAYLKGHPKINPKYYLANLRTTIRIR